ncbi:MAG: flavodoxin family protein [Paludibacteraceae bacterium]|nr:flavodoxin family protein [Paludibacteraceae bacterium]
MGRVTVLMGSPRPNGNTAKLVEAFVGGLGPQHSVEVVNVAKLGIQPCRGCNFCFKNSEHRCSQHDDMEQVYALLSKTDVLVVATPVYFYGISAQLKALVDRLHNPLRDSFPISKMALLAVGAATLPNLSDSILCQYHLCLDFFHLDDCGTVLVRGVKEAGDIEGNLALVEAKNLASKI